MDVQGNMSTAMLCPEEAPDSPYYFQNMSTLNFSFIIMVSILSCVSLVFYFVKVYFIFKYISNVTHRPGKLAWLAAIYPYTSIGCLIGLCVPRAVTICEIFILLYLARCMFVYIELVIEYFGSRLDMATQLAGRHIQLNIGPLCRCCTCCPNPEPTVTNIRYIELLVYQVAIIRPLLFLINGVVWAEEVEISAFSTTITVLNFISTITAMYGFMIMAKFCAIPLRHYRINVWMRLAQVVILLFNLQGPIFNLVASFGGITCSELMPAISRAAAWNNYLLIFEMFLLTLCSSWLLRPAVNAMFDRHPLYYPGTGVTKGLIKPKASIRYYQTEPSVLERLTADGSVIDKGIVQRLLTVPEDQTVESTDEEHREKPLPLLK